MERKIGETFEYEGKKLRVEADNDSECKRCYLNDRCPDINTKIIGECVNIHRQDKTSVAFVEINDEQSQEQAEQPQKLNLCEILKDCPKRTEFWSDDYGIVRFDSIFIGADTPIRVTRPDEYYSHYTKEGWHCKEMPGSCLLWPSIDCRDWSKFTAPWYKKERFDPKTLKPFDRVVVRNIQSNTWRIEYFSHIDERCKPYPFYCSADNYAYCIPYNDDTKHLVGTTDEAPDFYRYWED